MSEGKIVFAGIIVAEIPIYIAVSLGSEASIKRSGYILQVFGMIFAIVGLLNIRVHYTNDLIKSLVGLFLLTIGITMSTLALELSGSLTQV